MASADRIEGPSLANQQDNPKAFLTSSKLVDAVMKKILIVEDDADIQRSLSGIFRNYGYNVIQALNAEFALSRMKEEKESIGLIITDMMMPGMSGRETTETIRKDPNLKALNIACLTVARFSVSGKDTRNKLKVLDYITKPFANEGLVTHVQKMVQ